MRKASLLSAALVTFSASFARAEVQEAALRVEQEWKGAGAAVERGEPRFLTEADTVSVNVPERAGPCATLAIIGARGLSFHARVVDPPEDDDRADRASSVAGVLEFSRCGPGAMRRVAVTTEAGRGVIETVMGYSLAPVPSLRTVLPERTGGTLPPPSEPGGLPPLAPPEKRAEIAEARAARDGGRAAARDRWQAVADGSGEGHLMLEAGCHRVELFAVDPRSTRPTRRFRLDLDAELRGEDTETLLARDRTDAPDARLELCVGVATAANVVFAGSPGNAPVVVTHASWPIPEKLPLTWGQETRARMAAVLLSRHAAPPSSEAVMLAQGPSGLTSVPTSLEPGACYVAVAAIGHGHARGIGLRALVGALSSSDDRGTNDEAALVSFCARDRDRARLEVEARGLGIAWGLAVFRYASASWEAP